MVGPAAHFTALPVKENVIDTPGVDADAVQLRFDRERLFQSRFQLPAELRIIPVERAVPFGRAIREPVDFGQRQFSAFQFADDSPAA
ncbi:hypothetical protein SDC9_205015 [bioreactor metagenome]|uniref:Uncharacterized protein n=1 Tax=bioreactor metagenome TaxID=1076179 RepID=A0A645J152_9ZZZZ